MSNHYIDNKKFLDELLIYKNKLQEAHEKCESKPVVPRYLGECFIKIANHLSYRPNFINYTYREEMVADGIENCLKCVDNFDAEKSNNPFAYFTQVTYYAFIRRIKTEKKQSYVKGKMIMSLPFDAFDLQAQDQGDDSNFTNSYMNYIQMNNVYGDIIEKEEESQRNKKAQKNKSNTSVLTEFFE
jgi:hypothetical protein